MLQVFLTIGAGILGLLVGAIMNAKVMRTRDSMEFTNGRACSVCAVPVKKSEMLPIVGYMAMKGRCGKCLSVVPWQYPATELALGILFGLFAARALYHLGVPEFVMPGEEWLLFIRDAAMSAALVMVFMFDYRASVIPDRVTIPAMIVAIVLNVILGMPVLELLLGGLVVGGFFAIQLILSRGRWVGGGDVRMGMLMGFILGPILGIVGLFLSYVSGAFVGVILLLTKKRSMDSHVPFGTFLALATFAAMFFGDQLVNWYLNLLR